MSTKAKRHTHMYHSISIGFSSVWACALPNCNHYMPKHMEEMVPGKNSICWSCKSTFILDPEAMKEKNPRCMECRGIVTEDENIPLSSAMEAFINRNSKVS